MKRLVAITGGIGSGKSVVSAVLRIMGYPVYDCDSNAKRLMDDSASIKVSLAKTFGREVVAGGVIDRRLLASIVFNDPAALGRLNAIVHPAVVADVFRWRDSRQDGIVFVETAILRESGLLRVVDGVVLVMADEAVRIHRVMKRNGLSEKEVRERIASQGGGGSGFAELPVYILHNSGDKALLPQISSFLNAFSRD